ncbi:ankyrin repeat domain-containing protein [Spiroplasma endosymbiont of Melieria omissa]|uniref:ankyrin repeat domain-containing protein n=1 Tax=Spiroplasma endosymbiont of Melieria omissa TaxID=3139324 RepID=UPI003CCA9A4C
MPKNKFLTAIEEGDLQTVKTLLLDSDNNKFDMEDALITAADYGHIEIVRFLIQNNTDINHINSTKDTALTLAAEQGHTEIVNLLITNGANVNYINKIWQYCFNKGH